MKIKIGNEFDKNYLMITDLSQLQNIQDHSCEEILIDKILDKIEFNARYQIKEMILQKLAINGFIKIGGIDLDSVCNEYADGKINPMQLIQLLYMNNRSCDSIENILGFFQSKGLNAVHINLQNLEYYIEFQRQ